MEKEEKQLTEYRGTKTDKIFNMYSDLTKDGQNEELKKYVEKQTDPKKALDAILSMDNNKHGTLEAKSQQKIPGIVDIVKAADIYIGKARDSATNSIEYIASAVKGLGSLIFDYIKPLKEAPAH